MPPSNIKTHKAPTTIVSKQLAITKKKTQISMDTSKENAPHFIMTPELRELVNKLNEIGTQFEALYVDESLSTRVRNKKVQDLLIKYNELRTQIPHSYYPHLTNTAFNAVIASHPLFQLYKIPVDELHDQQLVEGFKTNKDLHKGDYRHQDPFFTLTPTQKFLREFMSPSSPYRGLLIWHGTGVGKCHAINTPIIMYNGTIKLVQDIIPGDTVMGTNSEKRNVLNLGRGTGQLYRVACVAMGERSHPQSSGAMGERSHPQSSGAMGERSHPQDYFDANADHILILHNTSTKLTEQCNITTFLSMSTTQRAQYKLIKTNIFWNSSFIKYISPTACYSIGNSISTADDSVLQSMMPTMLLNTMHNRLHFIAGLLDSAATISVPPFTHFIIQLHGVCNCSRGATLDRNASCSVPPIELVRQIVLIIRSTGLLCNETDGVITVTGDRLISEIPFKKWRPNNIAPRTYMDRIILNYVDFTVTAVGDANGQYYGFTLDGNHCYLVENCVITHNTCTAITIAENLKMILDEDAKDVQNITILREAEFIRQMLDMSKIRSGKPDKQCTGMSFLQSPQVQYSLRRCMEGRSDDCDTVEKKVKKEIRATYNLTNPKKWAMNIRDKLEYLAAGHTAIQREVKIRKFIRDVFNNTVLIIDEAHNFILDKSISSSSSSTDIPSAEDSSSGSTAGTTGDDKIVSNILKLVVRYAQNMRLILLTATPMFDTARDIISILNYLLMNDKRPQLVESEIFDTTDNLKKPDGTAKLLEGARGYISYMRGNSPFDFPLRISARHNVLNRMLDEYPRYTIEGLRTTSRIQFLDIVTCPLAGIQLQIVELYNKTIKQSVSSGSRRGDEVTPNSGDFVTPNHRGLWGSEVTPNHRGLWGSEVTPSSGDIIDAIVSDSLLEDIGSSSITLPSMDAAASKLLTKEGSRIRTSTDNRRHEEELLAQFEKSVDVNVSAVAYSDERQISNFVFQSLDETNNNLELCYGRKGLKAIATPRIVGAGVSYSFKNPEHAKRFIMPELENWSSKMAMILDTIKNSSGPVFIYSFFVQAGAIPIAMALEMNGYKRYKMHGVPLVHSQYKTAEYRGDYVMYTSDSHLSAHSEDYLKLREKMIYEKSVKVFIGSGKGSEGLNLFGYREVYIYEPWYHINKLEQSIGRVIRQGSHNHLPPQERNVSVYLCATTMKKIESRELAIYKVCEQKAVASGIIEKLLKENAIDCEFNLEDNQYSAERFPGKIPIITSQKKHVEVSLADQEYSKFCFYQKDCTYKCNTISKKDIGHRQIDDIYHPPYMSTDYDKIIEEMTQKIKQLLLKYYNVSLDNLIAAIQPPSMQLFNSAILQLLSTKIRDIKRGIEYNIVMIDDTIRLIESTLPHDVSLYRQLNPRPPDNFAIKLQHFTTQLHQRKEKLQATHEINYNDVITTINHTFAQYKTKTKTKSEHMYTYNVPATDMQILNMIYQKLSYNFKLNIFRKLLGKLIEHTPLQGIELELKKLMQPNFVTVTMIYPERSSGSDSTSNKKSGISASTDSGAAYYGFMIANINELELWKYNDEKHEFALDLGNKKRLLENQQRAWKWSIGKLYAYMVLESRDSSPFLKIVDKIAKGEKESVKGLKCNNMNGELIRKYLKLLYPNFKYTPEMNTNKAVRCNDIELGFINKPPDGTQKWYLSTEERIIHLSRRS
jgi:hypothetical protein